VFQNKAATSRKTLPVTILYGIVMSLLLGVVQKELWLQALGVIVTVYIMIIINNGNALIRIYSRLASCTALVLTVMVASLDESPQVSISQALFAAHILTLFYTYQDKRSMVTVCMSFMFIGLISTMFIEVLFLVPFIWLILATRMQAASARNYAASVIGLIVPYWFWGAYSLYDGSYMDIVSHVAGIASLMPIGTSILEPHLLISMTFVTIIGMLGVLHFLRYSYQDSIKTRMLFYSFISLSMLLLVFIILQPQHSSFLLRFLIVTVSPLVAHYFTFTKSWLTNYFFIASIVTAVLLTVYNTWIS